MGIFVPWAALLRRPSGRRPAMTDESDGNTFQSGLSRPVGGQVLAMQETCPICFSEDDHRWIFRDLDDGDSRGLVGRQCRSCGNEWWFEKMGRAG